MKEETEKEIQKIEEFINLRDKEILDVGCGDGRLSILLADKKVKSLIAIDPDQESIEKAKKEQKSKIKNLHFELGSGENLNFQNESFDVVLFSFSLHHHKDSIKSLKEAHRVLRKDGRLIILESTYDSEIQQFFNISNDETEELKNTLNIIKNNNNLFEIEKEETFLEDSFFEDTEDLYKYFLDSYEIKKEKGIIEKMNSLLGNKINSKPILLKDKINIFSLRKK